ncbi:hypothetical protein [Reichenbachiella versicolor]|uniref:hypothetical protein n=1 Tax=Reichenbachiella versicolor TaxID=1821036 RepID=UPI000D6DF149|nr:hypothetical protein [Reichenbachiella versicolor]
MLFVIKVWLENAWKTLVSILRVAFLSKYNVNLPKLAEKEQGLVILGNGPSLKSDLTNWIHTLDSKDIMCVNHFPITQEYIDLKPKYYITSAPDLWLDDIDEKFVIASKKLFETMAEVTDWSITFFIPFEAKKYTRWKEQLVGNHNIKIVYFNNIGVEGFLSFSHLVYRLKLGMPRPHNIMIPSITNAIIMGYKKIYLWGVDHSWLPEISVTKQNDVLLHQKHFYDEGTSKASTLDKRGKGKRKLFEVLHKFMLAFEGYFLLKDFANSMNVEIINTTEGSFIDAFEKVSLKDL